MKKTDWIKNNYFAHRGLHNKLIPENSMASFLHAVEKGYHIELDIKMTKDKRLVVIHDYNLKRLCGVNITVGSSNYDDIKDYKLLKSDETIPLLDTVLNALPDTTLLLLELKSSKNNKVFVKLFLDTMKNYKHTYAVHSFDPRIVYLFKKYAPHLVRGQIAKNMSTKNGKIILRSLTSFLEFLTKPDFINYRFIDLPYKKLDRQKKKGMLILSYIAKSQTDLDFVRSRYDNAVFENFEPKQKA